MDCYVTDYSGMYLNAFKYAGLSSELGKYVGT